MSRTVELEIGDLYASLHEQFSIQVGEDYEERARQQFEEFLHGFNQQVERQVEEAQAEQEQFDLTDEDVEVIEEEDVEATDADGEADAVEAESE